LPPAVTAALALTPGGGDSFGIEDGEGHDR
jgi:hypothetical protein